MSLVIADSLDRLELVATRAARLVEERLGESLPVTHVVAARNRCAQATKVLASEVAVTVGSAWRLSLTGRLRACVRWAGLWRGGRDGIAQTVIAPRGVLIVVRANAIRCPQLEEYLVHEMVHAIQMTRLGRRRQLQSLTAHTFGLAQLDDDALYREWMREQIDEGEAYRVQLAYVEHAARMAVA